VYHRGDAIGPEPVTDVVDGRFEIEREAGAGGMARVYRARDITTGEVVALKVLNNVEDSDLRRFAREVRALAELDHPSIVRYIAHGRTEQGLAYLAMEWLDGVGLDAVLRAGPLPIDGALAVARGVAGALAIAHARGLVHRDVKPANVFLARGAGPFDRAKLLDFGLARDAIAAMALTSTGELLGTPLYMSPEQARGERDLDARADIYSLGATLYAMLAGRPPLVAPNLVGLLAKIIVEDPQPVCELRPEVPRELARLVEAMLAKSRDERPADGGAAVAAMSALYLDEPASPRQEPRRPTPPPALREQRVCTILMASGVDTTVTLDATEVSTLDPRHGGALALADGSRLVVFTGPESPADLAAKAAQYALGVRAAGTRIAVATGRASLSGAAPVGEVIDRAARQLARAAGTIRCDAETAGLIESRFVLTIDGDGAELVNERRADRPVDTLLGRPSRYIGRDRELAALEGFYAECISESVARAVVVVADPGVGKSRLARELFHRVARRDDPPRLWLARGEPATMSSPFAAIVAAISRVAGIEPVDTADARAAKLAGVLAATGAPAFAAELLAELLGCARGVPTPRLRAARESPSLMLEGIREAWLTWLGVLCDGQPQLLVIEDLHWVDAASIALLDAALAGLAERPVMVLALARPDIHDRTPAPFAERRPHELRLDPLPRRASERLVRDALGAAATDERVAAIVARADGNALFLEELVRAAAGAQTGSVPVGVIGTLQLRFDGLSADGRLAARAASVIGERFARDAVAALVPRIDAGAAIAELVGDELVAGDGAAMFRFRHALVRDAAYALIADDDRAAAHALAGDYLAGADVVDAAVVARHYELGLRDVEAAQWYRRAAEYALAHHDLGNAIAHARAAHRFAGGDRATATALDQIIAEAEMWRGNLVAARDAAEVALARLVPGSAEWLAAASLMITTAGQLGDNDAIAAWLARLDEVDPPFTPQLVGSLARVSAQLVWTDHVAAADAALARAERLARRSDAIDLLTQARLEIARSYVAFRSGELDRCFLLLDRSRQCQEQIGGVRDALQADLISAGMRLFAGQLERAEVGLMTCFERARALHATYMCDWAQWQLGNACSVRGDRDGANRWHAQVPDVVRSTPLFTSGGSSLRAWASLQAGDLDDVDEQIRALRKPGIASRFRLTADALAARVLGLRGGPGGDVAAAAAAAHAGLVVEHMQAELHLIGLSVALIAMRDVGAAGVADLLASHRAHLVAIAAQNSPEVGAAFLSLPWNDAVMTAG
jgi:hypothetical protein